MTTEQNSPNSPDPLGRELMRQAQLIAQLRRDVDELAHSTTDIAADLLARFEERDDNTASRVGSTNPWCWRDLGQEAQQELWRQLTDWISWLRHRYPLAKKIPPCWPEHPEIVEELTALWLAWQSAYVDPNGSLTGAAEWHDRWLPGFLHRIDHGPFAVDCMGRHASRPKSAYASRDVLCATSPLGERVD